MCPWRRNFNPFPTFPQGVLRGRSSLTFRRGSHYFRSLSKKNGALIASHGRRTRGEEERFHGGRTARGAREEQTRSRRDHQLDQRRGNVHGKEAANGLVPGNRKFLPVVARVYVVQARVRHIYAALARSFCVLCTDLLHNELRIPWIRLRSVFVT